MNSTPISTYNFFQYLAIFHTICEMVIIKNKKHKINLIKIYMINRLIDFNGMSILQRLVYA